MRATRILTPAVLGALAAVCLLGAAPAQAKPDITVGFDTLPAGGTPLDGLHVEREFQSRGIYFLPGGFAEAGFPAGTPATSPSTPFACGRPPIITASGLATSPTRALGPSRCIGGGPVEFPDNAEDILGVFTTYRSRVSLRIGPRQDVVYTPPSPPFAEIVRPWDASLVAYDVNYNEVGRSEIHLAEHQTIPAGLHYTLSVTSPANNIAFIYVRGPYAAAAPSNAAPTNNYLVDDITYDDPDVPPPPNLVLGQSPAELRVRRGATATRAFSLLRFNDAGAAVTMAVDGLPSGIVASNFSPNPVPGSTSTLSVTAAALTSANSSTATVTASGSGLPTRSVSLPVRIVDNFRLITKQSVQVPACRDVDLGLNYALEDGFTGTIDVSAAIVTPDRHLLSTVTNGGKLYPGFPDRPAASVYAQAADPAARADVLVRARSGDESQSEYVSLQREALSLTGVDGTPAAPQELAPGRMVITGRSFCPNAMSVTLDGTALPVTSVSLGTGRFDDAISIDVPRTATGGTLEVKNTANGETAKRENVQVTTWRNTNGFPFENYGGFRVSYGLMQQVFGDQVQLKLNICSAYTFGLVDCGPEINTGFPSPQALIWIAALNTVFATGASDDAHCFGMSLAAVKLRLGRLNRAAFPPAPATTFMLDGATGPSGALSAQIDRDHLRQFSAEVFRLGVRPAMTPAGLRDAVRGELARSRPVPVSIRKDALSGHTLVIYDITDRTGGGFDLHVYDPNEPAPRRNQPPIVVSSQGGWSYARNGWSGGMPTIRLVPIDAVPDRPEFLNSLSDVLSVISGSLDSVEDANGKKVTPQTVPVYDEGVGNGYVVLPRGGTYTLHTRPKAGPYDIAVQGGGVMTSVQGIRPPAGARSSADAGDALTFSARTGAITLDPAAGPSPLDATISTKVRGGGMRTAHVVIGRDDGSTIAFDRARSTLQIMHRGPATTMRLELGEVGPTSTPDSSRFRPVPLARGQRITLKPGDWSDPRTVVLRVAAGPGKGRMRTLRDTSRPRAPVKIGRVAVRTVKGGKATVTVPVRFGTLAPGTTASVAVLVSRGRRVVARRVIPLPTVSSSASRTFTLDAARLRRGRHLAQAVVVVVTPGDAGLVDSATKRRSVRFSARG